LSLTWTPFPGYPWYQIGVAFSADGRSFERLPASESPYAGRPTPFENIDGLVWYGSDAFPNMANMHDGLVADPEVVIVDDVWHLFSSSVAVDQDYAPIAFGISHATSNDGIHWVYRPDNPVMGGPAAIGHMGRIPLRDLLQRRQRRREGRATQRIQRHWPYLSRLFHGYSTDGATGEAFTTSDPNHVFSWDESFSYERYAWLTGADVALREDGYWLFYTGFSDVNPPENFLIPANNDCCKGAGDKCICYEEENGSERCLLESVTTFDLARRTR